VLLRRDGSGVLAIGQASHAWLSGQLARAWGNERFGSVDPWDEVCLAADQHDVGWLDVDLEPIFDPASGLPREFMNMPLDVHLDLWTRGPRQMLTQSSYAALLVSMHGWRLYERRDLDRASPEDAAAIREFLSQELSFREQLIEELHPDLAELDRNSLLLWTWDYLSLALCLSWDPATARGAPALEGRVDLELRPTASGSFTLEPWPFSADTVAVRCEGRCLPERFADEAEMLRGLAQAPVETLSLVLARSA
jgi:Protein of unknown function (DUF3891)